MVEPRPYRFIILCLLILIMALVKRVTKSIITLSNMYDRSAEYIREYGLRRSSQYIQSKELLTEYNKDRAVWNTSLTDREEDYRVRTISLKRLATALK
jgi:hypothetical protein